jgi:hypothetical protein
MASVEMMTAAFPSSTIPVAITTCTGAAPMTGPSSWSDCATGAYRTWPDDAERSSSARYPAAAAKPTAGSERAIRCHPAPADYAPRRSRSPSTARES